jgi:nucleotide-binding universal stress UspA family protein
LNGKITGETMKSKHSSALSPTLEYRKIMISLDRTEMSDKALIHTAYISKISGADLVILNVIETEVLSPSFTLAFLELESSLEQAKEKLRNQMEGGVKEMLEQRLQWCKEMVRRDAKISYTMLAGKPVYEITKAAEEGDYGLIVMASSRVTSKVRILGGTARKVLDSVRNAVLVIHE